MKEINSNIEFLSEYITSKTKIHCKCKIDGYEWYPQPSNLLQGQGCPKCFGRIRTHDEFISDMKIINPSIKIIGKYERSAQKIECHCLIHNYKWFIRPNGLLQGQGCSLCAKEKLRKYKLLSQEEFENKIKDINPDIIILGRYSGSKENIKVKCLKCKHEWLPTGDSLLQGKGCPKCGGTIKKTDEDFMFELQNKKPHIISTEKYIDALTKIKFKCLIHNCEWKDTPAHILRDRGCPECAKESYRNLRMKSHDDFIKELSVINPNIKVLDKYNGFSNKILCQCIKDNYKWKAFPSNLLKGVGCPLCSNSHGENRISNYLNENKIVFLTQYTFNGLVGLKGGLLSYDFFIPKNNILIEYNGKQHYKPVNYFGGEEQLKIQQEHDKRKRKFAQENNIQLLEIPYWEYDNIGKILQKYLKEVA